MKSTQPTIYAAIASRHFAHQDGILYRRRADGTFKIQNTINGGRLVVILDKQRIDGAAVVWCLVYGRWPKYALAVVDGNPLNMELRNIWPIFTKAVRFRLVPKGTRFGHPLTAAAFDTPEACRRDWNARAVERYRMSVQQVLDEEKREQDLRDKALGPSDILLDYERRQKLRAAAYKKNLKGHESVRRDRPDRPTLEAGQCCYWYLKAWHVVPEPVHVSDDYRMRISAYARGAVLSKYEPMHGETFYYDAAGEPVRPA